MFQNSIPETIKVKNEPCSTGLKQETAVILAYIFSLVFVLIESKNKFVRFCAAQGLLLLGAWLAVIIIFQILTSIPILGLIFVIAQPLAGLLYACIIGFLAFQSYKQNKIKLPLIGNIAEEWSEVSN